MIVHSGIEKGFLSLISLDEVHSYVLDSSFRSAFKDLGKNFNDDLLEIEQTSQKVTNIAYPKDTNHLAAFGHLLGGYDAAYYGYLWAEIIGDDLFSRFEDEGVLSNSVGVDYKNKILKPGGTISAENMVQSFLGRKWNDKAFLFQKNLLI